MILYLKIIPERGDEVHEACSQLKQNDEKNCTCKCSVTDSTKNCQFENG